MNIEQYIKTAIAQIQQEKQKELAIVRERVMREKVVPYNQEVDKARIEAETKLTNELNMQINALREQFARDKQVILEASNKKKEEFLTTIIATETYALESEYDNAIAKLTSQLEDLKKE